MVAPEYVEIVNVVFLNSHLEVVLNYLSHYGILGEEAVNNKLWLAIPHRLCLSCARFCSWLRNSELAREDRVGGLRKLDIVFHRKGHAVNYVYLLCLFWGLLDCLRLFLFFLSRFLIFFFVFALVLLLGVELFERVVHF